MRFLKNWLGGSQRSPRSEAKFRPSVEGLEMRDQMSTGWGGLDLGAIAQGGFAGLDLGIGSIGSPMAMTSSYSSGGLDLGAIANGSFAGLDNGLPTGFALTSPLAFGGPGSIGDLVQANLAQDDAFFRNAWQTSVAIARATPDNVDFSDPMRLFQSTNDLNRIYSGFNSAAFDNSNRALSAVGNYGTFGIRGMDVYGNGYGQQLLLPGGPAAYHYGPQGYLYAGVSPYPGMSLFPGGLFI